MQKEKVKSLKINVTNLRSALLDANKTLEENVAAPRTPEIKNDSNCGGVSRRKPAGAQHRRTRNNAGKIRRALRS